MQHRLLATAFLFSLLAAGCTTSNSDPDGDILVPGAVSAGADQSVPTSTRVLLTPSANATADVDSFEWIQTAGSQVNLQSTLVSSIEFVTPDTSGVVELEVAGLNGAGEVVGRDRVRIIVTAARPEITSSSFSTISVRGGGPGRATSSALHGASRRLFIIDSVAGDVVVYDVSNPSSPSFAGVVSAPGSAPGYTPGQPLAVAAGDEGAVAITWTGETVEFPGRLQLIDPTTLTELNAFSTTGGNPVDVDISKDGEMIAVACAGDREFFGQGNGRGYVTVVQVPASGAADIEIHRDVAPITFGSLDGTEATLMQSGIRFFGASPSASTHIAPRAVAISPQKDVIWAACPENDALVTIDPIQKLVSGIEAMPDRADGSLTQGTFAAPLRRTFTSSTLVATSPAGDQVTLGGFTGIVSRAGTANSYRLITGAGPTLAAVDTNGDGVAELPFVDPDAPLRFEDVSVDPVSNELSEMGRTELRGPNGETITGRPNVYVGNPGEANHDERAINLFGSDVAPSEYGARFAGGTESSNGEVWLADSRRCSIWRFSPSGVLSERFAPLTTPVGLGTNNLPESYSRRRANLDFPVGRRFGGFGAIAYDQARGTIIAITRLPLDNPQSPGNLASESSRVVRVLELNATNGIVSGEYLLLLDQEGHAIEGLSSNGSTDFFPERVGFIEAGPTDSSFFGLYSLSFAGATNLRSLSPSEYAALDPTIETRSPEEFESIGLIPLGKRLVADLSSAGLGGSGLPSGLLLDGTDFVVSFDNGFDGISGASFDSGPGSIGPVLDAKPLALGFGTLQTVSLDTATNGAPSGQNSVPAIGMPQPLDLAVYPSSTGPRVAMANGGRPRVLPSQTGLGGSYDERVRADSLVLDTSVFPSASTWSPNPFGGDLIVSLRESDLDGNNLTDRLAIFGSRSISVADRTGVVGWTSPGSLNVRTAIRGGGWDDSEAPRSGMRPRAVATGTVGPTWVLATALEGSGDVTIHSLANPAAPSFSGFVAAAQAPVDVDLLVLDNDASLIAITDAETGQVQLRRLTLP